MSRFLSVTSLAALSVCLGFVSTHAYAQVVPGSADVGQFEGRFLKPEPKDKPFIEERRELVIADTIPAATDGFELKSVSLQGVTAFAPDYFDRLIEEYKGRSVDLNVLRHLAARITKVYRDNGYFLSRAVVPEQAIENGSVKLQVIEGYVREVVIQDPDNVISFDAFSILSDTVHKIKQLSPLNGEDLERYVLLLNDTANVEFSSILQAPEKADRAGAVDIILRVKAKEAKASLSYDNFGSRYVGPHQFSALYQSGGLFTALDTVTAQLSTAVPMSEVMFGSLRYSMPFSSSGWRLNMEGSYSKAWPGYTLDELHVEGDNVKASVGVYYPFIRTRSTDFGVEFAFAVSNAVTEFFDEELIQDRIRMAQVTLDYSAVDPWNGILNGSTVFKKGINIFGATRTGDALLSREQGRSDFVSISTELERTQNLLPQWQLTTRFAGQFSPYPLLSSEEFSYGGTTYGRAYDPSEITGDQGVVAAAEMRYTGLDKIPGFEIRFVPFAFYDIGKVWNKDSGSKPESAASAGFGTYYSIGSNGYGSLQVAYPLTKDVNTPIMNGADGPRVLFSLGVDF